MLNRNRDTKRVALRPALITHWKLVCVYAKANDDLHAPRHAHKHQRCAALLTTYTRAHLVNYCNTVFSVLLLI